MNRLINISRSICDLELFDSSYRKRIARIQYLPAEGNLIEIRLNSNRAYMGIFAIKNACKVNFNNLCDFPSILTAGIYKTSIKRNIHPTIPDSPGIIRGGMFDEVVKKSTDSTFLEYDGVDFFYIVTSEDPRDLHSSYLADLGASCISDQNVISEVVSHLKHSDATLVNGLAKTSFLSKSRSWVTASFMNEDGFEKCDEMTVLSGFDNIRTVTASFEWTDKGLKCITSARISFDVEHLTRSQMHFDEALRTLVSLLPHDVSITSSFQELILHSPAHAFLGFMPSLRHIINSKQFRNATRYSHTIACKPNNTDDVSALRIIRRNGRIESDVDYRLMCGETPYITKGIILSHLLLLLSKPGKIAFISSDESLHYLAKIISEDRSVFSVGMEINLDRMVKDGLYLINPSLMQSHSIKDIVHILEAHDFSVTIDANDAWAAGALESILNGGYRPTICGGAGLFETYKSDIACFLARANSESSDASNDHPGYYSFVVNFTEDEGELYIPHIIAILANATQYDAMSILSSIDAGYDPSSSIKIRVGDILRG